MEVVLAQPRGFCAGVVRAVKIVGLTSARLLLGRPQGLRLLERYSL